MMRNQKIFFRLHIMSLDPCWPSDFKWVQDLRFPSSCGCDEYKIKKCAKCTCLDITSESPEESWADSHLCIRKRSENPGLMLLRNGKYTVTLLNRPGDVFLYIASFILIT